MKQEDLLKYLPPLFTILVADLMVGVYYVIFVDAFILMAGLALIAGTVISLFLNGWDYKSLFTKPTAAITLASVGLFVGLELYIDFLLFPFGLVVVFTLVGAALPWIVPALAGVVTAQRGKQKQVVANAAGDDAKETAPETTAKVAVKNGDPTNTNLLIAFVLFVGNGDLFYGILGLVTIFAASVLFFSFIALTTVTFWTYVVLLMISLMAMRLITTRQKKETTDDKKEGKAIQPDTKSED